MEISQRVLVFQPKCLKAAADDYYGALDRYEESRQIRSSARWMPLIIGVGSPWTEPIKASLENSEAQSLKYYSNA